MTVERKRRIRVWTNFGRLALLIAVLGFVHGPVEAADGPGDRDRGDSKVLAPVSFPVDLGAIPAGATVTLEFDVQVSNPLTSFPAVAVSNQGTVTGTGIPMVVTDDPATGPVGDPTVTPLDTADLVLTKTDSPDPVVAGAPLQYSLMVMNNGPSAAENVVVTDVLPTGVTLVGTTGCAEDPNGVPTCSLGTIPASASAVFTIDVTVDATASGPLVNTASVVSTTAEAAPGNEMASSTTTVVAEADLSITKNDSLDPVTAGTDLSYTLVVSNLGPSDDSTTVTVTDTLPAGVNFVSATGSGWSCGSASGVVTCTRAGLALGSAPAIDIVVAVDPATRGTLSNTAAVSSPTTDPNAANDQATEITTVAAEADLGLTKTDSADPPPPGDPLVYTLTVTNDGPSDATGVTVTDTLPAGVTFVDTVGCAEDPNGVPICTLGTIAAGASAQYTISVLVDPGPPPTITNTASVSGTETDPDLSNNDASEETTLDAEPPTVDVLSTYHDTGDGRLDECETATGEIYSLLWSFSELLNDPPGSSDPDDVTNPDNYRVLTPGADHSFATDMCGPVLGDDVELPALWVLYGAGASTAALSMPGSLDASLYRVMACGSTSIVDLAGNPLDGTGNGVGGDDFVLTFRADPLNALDNGHFDCDLAGWTLTSATPGEIVFSPDDADNSDLSGSVEITNLAMNTDFSVSQCGAVQPSQELSINGVLRFSAAPLVAVSLTRECAFYSTPDCTGSSLSTSVVTVLAGDTGGAWVPFGGVADSPGGAASALCDFRISNPTGADFNAWFDQLYLNDGSAVFSDAFESGDPSAWSAVTGE